MKKKRKAGDVSMNKIGRKSYNKLSLPLVFTSWCLIFLLYPRFGLCNRDSYICCTGINHHWKDIMLESFLSSIDNNCSAICKPQDSQQSHGELNQAEKATISENRKNQQQEELEEVDGSVKQKNETLSRPAYIGLDEFRNKTLRRKKNNAHDLLSKILNRLEPGGKEYNYASSSKGAKVLAHNKEAKGAGNILERDKDKYLRNPCSAEGKFIVIELSEETLVDSVEIANLEHYSSNFKDFELSGSLSYPTETWIPLGTFTAENVKHAQRFTLSEPKWVRYMRLSLVSHYGSEFYCTLSFLEVYGVDAIEKLLEDFIAVPDESACGQVFPLKLEVNSSEKGDIFHVNDGDDVPTKGVDVDDLKKDVPKSSVPNQVKEVRQQLAGRIPSDAVLKILMQKVRSLELSLSVLEEYIRELDRRYGGSLPDLQKEVSQNALLMENIRSKIKDLMESKEVMEKEYSELEYWKSIVTTQLDALIRDNAFLRVNVEKFLRNQEIMENKELIILIMSLFFACFALFKLICDWILKPFRTCEPEKIHTTSRVWLLLFVSSSVAAVIALL